MIQTTRAFMIFHKSPEVRNVQIWLIWWFSNIIKDVTSFQLSWHPPHWLFSWGWSPRGENVCRNSRYHNHTQQCPKPEDRMSLLLVLYKVQEGFLKASPPTPASPLADSIHIPLARIVSPAIPKTNQGKENGVSIGYTNGDSSPGGEVGPNFP